MIVKKQNEILKNKLFSLVLTYLAEIIFIIFWRGDWHPLKQITTHLSSWHTPPQAQSQWLAAEFLRNLMMEFCLGRAMAAISLAGSGAVYRAFFEKCHCKPEDISLNQQKSAMFKRSEEICSHSLSFTSVHEKLL